MRGKRLGRILKIIPLLKGPSSWNARKLGEHFQTSRRNLYRDMKVMELAGVPFYFDPDFGEGGGYRIQPGWFFPHVGLTDEECLDLAVVTRVVENRSIPLLDGMCEVRDKLLSTLPTKQQDLVREAGELFEVLGIGLAEHGHCREVMTALQQALLTRRQIEGLYASPQEKRGKRLELQPRRVFLCGNAWYLAAQEKASGETRLYRVARFKMARVLEKPMTIEADFSLRELLGNAWSVYRGDRDFHIEILFDREAAPLVSETRWHRTQELIPQKDGALVFRATVSGLEEVRWWILQWGPRAKVLRPRELVEEVRRLAQETARVYGLSKK